MNPRERTNGAQPLLHLSGKPAAAVRPGECEAQRASQRSITFGCAISSSARRDAPSCASASALSARERGVVFLGLERAGDGTAAGPSAADARGRREREIPAAVPLPVVLGLARLIAELPFDSGQQDRQLVNHRRPQPWQLQAEVLVRYQVPQPGPAAPIHTGMTAE